MGKKDEREKAERKKEWKIKDKKKEGRINGRRMKEKKGRMRGN